MNTNNSKEVIEYGCNKESRNALNIDMVDICSAMSIKGKVGGYSNTVAIDNFIEDALNNIRKSDFKNSKSMLLMANLNRNSDVKIIEKFMNTVYALVPEKCETRFGIAFTADIKDKDISYKILLTGI